MRIDVNIEVDTKDFVVAQYISHAVDNAIKASAEALLTEANKTAPKDEGILIQSGQVSYDGASRTGYVSYDTPYAIRLHEHPEYRFQNGRRGKWLEFTMNEQKSMLVTMMLLKLRQSIDAGGGLL